MAKEFKLEDPGEGITEAEVREVHVAKGDQVKDGDTLVSVETDKAVNDIPAPFTGTIESVEVKEGDSIKVGQVLVTYSEGAGEDKAKDGKEEAEAREEKDKADREAQKEEQPEEKEEKQTARKKEPEEKPQEKKPEQGKEQGKEQDKEQQEKRKAPKPDKEGKQRPVPAAPATRQLARDLEVDLHQVEPSGPAGRVTPEDVRAFAEQGAPREAEAPRKEEAPREQKPAAAEAPTLPDFSRWGEVERQPLRSIRRAVARQMSLSWSQIPHVMHQDIADVTELERFRRRHKDKVEERGGKLSLTVLVLKATIAALKRYPRFNASLDMANQEIILKRYHHIGLAVATERGLMVPVIREADRKDITELSVETAETANKAREGELKAEDMQGATFSLTNPGPIGATSFTPIINYPEVAILGMCSTRLEPVAIGDIDKYKVEARLRLPLCLVYDHRVNDGADAAHFLRTIIDILEDPESFLLSV